MALGVWIGCGSGAVFVRKGWKSLFRPEGIEGIDAGGAERGEKHREKYHAEHDARGGGKYAEMQRGDTKEYTFHGSTRGPGAEDAERNADGE